MVDGLKTSNGMDKKYVVFLVLVGIVVVALTIAFGGNMNRNENIKDFSLSPTPTAILDTSPTNTPLVKAADRPEPGIIIKDMPNYDYWFQQLDSQNRVLGIYDACGYMVPSNVAYKNNTTVMLDNTRSNQDLVIKVGDKDYPLEAREWKLVTLSTTSPTLPINLPIFCKNIELGQIELQ